MDFPQRIYVGRQEQAWPAVLPKDLPISAADIETAGDYAGSTHILEMGRHFDDYTRDDWEAPTFPAINGLPTSPGMQQLKMKARSPGVTGNIGEGLAGIVARQTLACDVKDIAHLVVKSKQKTPDFLIRHTNGIRSLLMSAMPGLAGRYLPAWWPLESKIRSDGLNNGAVNEGLRQLGSLWCRMKEASLLDVGYGIVVCAGLQSPREIRIHFFLPENDTKRQDLIDHLSSFTEYSDFVKSDLNDFAQYLLKYA
jgi:hypothetical protein